MKQTQTMKRALEWLTKRGGSGMLDNYGYLIAEGERSSFQAATWLRLIMSGDLFVKDDHLWCYPIKQVITDIKYGPCRTEPTITSYLYPNKK